jgi:Ca2+-binding RTX toxin-like protein
VLYVDGTDAAEQITVRGNEESPALEVTVGSEETTVPSIGVTRIVVRAGAGDDLVIVNLLVPVEGRPSSSGISMAWRGRLSVEGGDGNDELQADTPAGALLLGGSGDDALTGGPSRDVLRGGAGNDRLRGGDGRDTVSGGPGDDDLAGGEGRDRVRGGPGTDLFAGSDTAAERQDFGRGDTLLGQLVVLSEHVYVSGGTLHITGTDGANHVTVTQTVDRDHPDTAVRFDYAISLDGRSSERGSVEPGGKIKAVRVDARGGDDVVDLGRRTGPPDHAYVKTVMPVGVPVTVLGGSGNDQIYGGAAANVIDGGEGDDYVSGGSSDDRVQGGAGADRVFGEGGRDAFFAGDGPAEQLDRSADEPAVETPLPLATVEDGVLVFRGTDAADTIRVGQQLRPTARGSLSSPASVAALTYVWTSGDVTFTDTVPSGGRVKSVRVDAGGGDDVVDLSSTAPGTDDGPDLTAVTLPSKVSGGEGDDRLSGGAGDDEIFGGGGDDTADGAGGDDRVNGGDGHDTLFGGEGADEVGLSARLPWRPEDPHNGSYYYEPGNDTLSGGGGNDRVSADSGNDTADGGDGDDIVEGSYGDDVLRGGTGNDVVGSTPPFVPTAASPEYGADELFGGGGLDKMYGGPGDDRVRGEGDRDTFYDVDSPAELLDRESDEAVADAPGSL